MSFRDLFFKTTVAPAEPGREQPQFPISALPESPPTVPSSPVPAQAEQSAEAALTPNQPTPPDPPLTQAQAPAPIAPVEPAQPDPAPGLAEQPPDDGPIHIPHRGPAPFRPQTQRATEPIPADATDQQAPLKIPAPQPASQIAPPAVAQVATASPKAAISPSTIRSEAEPRERPRDKRATSKPRIPRHSSGWAAMLQHLKEEPSLRVLDIGPTSPNNINFLTNMGHSVYMADIVQDAVEGNWALPSDHREQQGEQRYDVERFYEQNFNFGDRRFEVVLLWTTIDYLPDPFIPALVSRLSDCMEPGGKLLAFFHTRSHGADTTFCRYHLVDSSEILMQEGEPYPVRRVYTNREIERLFKGFSGCRFFLARDNVYEVIITR